MSIGGDIMYYDSAMLLEDMKKFMYMYSGAERFSIGKSVMQKDIECLRIGKGEKKILISGAYHGLEYLTAAFIMAFMRVFCDRLIAGDSYFGYDIKRLAEEFMLYAIPMVNPDGVDIAARGLDISNKYHRELFGMVGIQDFVKTWQANARGVDINHNFDAHWQRVTDGPAPSKYGGKYAHSEPETKALTGFVRENSIDMLIAFHSQGREIYYDFNGMTGPRSLDIAREMEKVSGYRVCKPTGTGAFGGCKDWFIKEFGKEGFTVEVGCGKNPLPLEILGDIYAENAKIILCAMTEYVK